MAPLRPYRELALLPPDQPFEEEEEEEEEEDANPRLLWYCVVLGLTSPVRQLAQVHLVDNGRVLNRRNGGEKREKTFIGTSCSDSYLRYP